MTACDSRTRTDTAPVVANPATVPELPAPAQVTAHDTDTRTGYAAPGEPADDRRYVWPQSGDARLGSVPGRHTAPGPAHVTDPPSPNDHTARTGRAVAVTDTPGTEAVADTDTHDDLSNPNHVGRFTN